MPLLSKVLSNLTATFLAFAALTLLADEPVSYSELLSGYLSGFSTLEGHFEQTTSDQNSYHSSVYRGALWISKPNHFRVDTISPSRQSIVSDGADFWSYDKDLEQVIISKLNDDVNQVPILLFSSDIDSIEDRYDISGYEDEDGEHFLLQPISDVSLFRSLALEFRDGMPAAIRINAASGQVTTISLKQIAVNVPISDERFSFDVPGDVDVIDDR